LKEESVAKKFPELSNDQSAQEFINKLGCNFRLLDGYWRIANPVTFEAYVSQVHTSFLKNILNFFNETKSEVIKLKDIYPVLEQLEKEGKIEEKPEISKVLDYLCKGNIVRQCASNFWEFQSTPVKCAFSKGKSEVRYIFRYIDIVDLARARKKRVIITLSLTIPIID
jgi:hypothetical protein